MRNRRAMVMALVATAVVTSSRADEARPLTAKPLKGPYATLSEFCGPQPIQLKEGGAIECRAARRSDIAGPVLLQNPPSPIREARLILNSGGNPCGLTLRTAAGWFVEDHVVPCLAPAPGDPGVVRFSVEKLAGADVILLAIGATQGPYALADGKDDKGERFRLIGYQVQNTVLCSVGPSGTPSCLPPIRTRWTRTLRREVVKDQRSQLIGNAEHESGERTVSLGTSGLTLVGEAEKANFLDPRDPGGLAPGTYRATFP